MTKRLGEYVRCGDCRSTATVICTVVSPGTQSTCQVALTPAPEILSSVTNGSWSVFVVLYAIGFQLGTHPAPYTNTPGIGYFLLSGESFVSLIHSPAATLPSTPLRALAIFEGFTGAFTIAFFLFTLTRAVHR